MIQFALTSEVFYSFSINYQVSLLLKMEKLGYHPDFDALLKAVQIQLCISPGLHQVATVSRLMRLHLSLPVLSTHFLLALLRGYNAFSEQFARKYYVSPFSLNISQVGLPRLGNPEIVEEYELALFNHLRIEHPDQFTIGLVIQFLKDNEAFAKHGFFNGFSALIFNALMSDPRQ